MALRVARVPQEVLEHPQQVTLEELVEMVKMKLVEMEEIHQMVGTVVMAVRMVIQRVNPADSLAVEAVEVEHQAMNKPERVVTEVMAKFLSPIPAKILWILP